MIDLAAKEQMAAEALSETALADRSRPRHPQATFKRRLLHAVQAGIGRTALPAWYSRTRPLGTAAILCYHSVAQPSEAAWIEPENHLAPEQFERQLAFLARHRRVLALDEVVSAVEQGVALPAGAVVITFDDAYRDTLTVAAPLLARYGLPATLFLVTGWIDRQEAPEADQVHAALMHRTRDELVWGGERFNLCRAVARRAAFESVMKPLVTADRRGRARMLQEVRAQLAPAGAAPRLLLTWDEIRRLRTEFPGITLGVHTGNHLDLTAHPRPAVLAECQVCVCDFARELGDRPQFFAYPYNRCNETARAVVHSVGLRAAVTGRQRPAGHLADRFALPRFDVVRSWGRFRFITSGAYPALSELLLGRA